MDMHSKGAHLVTTPRFERRVIASRHPSVWVAVLAAAAIGAACGSSDPAITPATVDGDRILFERGTAALAEEDWLAARESFLQVRDNYPQSGLRADARLGVADSFAGQGSAANYVSALAEYGDFLSLYPTHPRAAYAQFRLALVHYRQMRPPERDQSWTQSAIREFQFLVERYPNSELVGEAQGYLREARNRLSESEFIVGRYYHRTKWWPGAIDRLGIILESDPAFSGREQVYFYLADAFYSSGKLEEALPMFQRLLEEFPETDFSEDATAALADIETRLAAAAVASPTPDDADDADDNASDPAPAPISG